jgi:magnesium-transporting ATPase (P-type)
MSLLATSLATLFLIVIEYLIISVVYPTQPFAASLIATVFTIFFPMVAKMLMDKEYHRSESSRQKWLFNKIASFNMLITSGLISTITPFTGTLDNRENSLPGLIPAVHTLFFSQLGLTPFMQLLDNGGNVQRHLLMPRAKTQQGMNMSMQGTTVFMVERYANLMKYLFLMLWYYTV